jgi:hypothetical protein
VENEVMAEGFNATAREGEILELRAENERLQKALSASVGYLMNAKIDLETGAPKRTAIRTIEGGIAAAKNSLNIHKPIGGGET